MSEYFKLNRTPSRGTRVPAAPADVRPGQASHDLPDGAQGQHDHLRQQPLFRSPGHPHHPAVGTDRDILYIQTLFGEPICERCISSGRGLLIQSMSHRRDRTSKLDKLLEELDAELDGRATEFLTAVRVDKSRYARDQFRLIHSLLDKYGVEAALQAIGFCQRSRRYSANTMRDYLEHQAPLPVAHGLSCLFLPSRRMTPSAM